MMYLLASSAFGAAVREIVVDKPPEEVQRAHIILGMCEVW
jgi:hypothetical protein